MTSEELLYGVLLILAGVDTCRGDTVEVLYDATVNFSCSPLAKDLSDLPPENVTRTWLLPDAQVLYAGTTGLRFTFF